MPGPNAGITMIWDAYHYHGEERVLGEMVAQPMVMPPLAIGQMQRGITEFICPVCKTKFAVSIQLRIDLEQ